VPAVAIEQSVRRNCSGLEEEEEKWLRDGGETMSVGYAPSSMRLIHATLHRALNGAVDLGLISSSPAFRLKLPRKVRPAMKTLTAEQAAQLCRVAEGTKWQCIWTLMLSTGIRVGETLALDWCSIDLVLGSVSVSASQDFVSGQILPPKTSASRRSIPLSPHAVAALRDHWRRQRDEQVNSGISWQTDLDVVFSGRHGQRLERHYLRDKFKSHLKAAHLPDIRLHDLRHTFATLCLERGANPKLVQQWMGHSSVALTMDTYSHVTPAMSLLVASIMEDVLSGRGPLPSGLTALTAVQTDVKSGEVAS
jgi:integrase